MGKVVSWSSVAPAIASALAATGRGLFTCPRDLACFSSNSRSAARSTCSVVASGMACDRPSLADSSSSRNWRLTLMWSRRRSAESGSVSSRSVTPRDG